MKRTTWRFTLIEMFFMLFNILNVQSEVVVDYIIIEAIKVTLKN